MGKIVVSENISLDGVFQDPAGDEGFARGGWFRFVGEEDRAAWVRAAYEEALRAEALLLGRRSDEWFAARWLPRSGEWADRLNGLPKYVVSSTPEEPRWSGATLLEGDVVEEISKLRRKLDGEIVVYGSRHLVRTLIEHDLVDEFRLMIFPVVLGAGERLFGETAEEKPLRLLSTRALGHGLSCLTYEPVRQQH